MAQRLQELCALFVEDNCGQLCSQIFTTLAESGRLSRAQLQHQLQQTPRIPNRKLRTALAVLVQQHVLLHHTLDDGTTFYQVDWRNTYYLSRSHRIMTLVEDRYGEGAGTIIANLLQLGHARVGDLAQAFDLETAVKCDSGIETGEHVNGGVQTNGTDVAHKADRGKIATTGQFHKTLRTLLKAGFLIKFHKQSYKPAADLQAELEETVMLDQFPDGKVTGPRKQAEFKTAVKMLKRKRRNDDDFSELRDSDSRGTIRRPGMQPAKRLKMNGRTLANGVVHDDDDSDEHVAKLPNDMVLRVNYAQCTLAFRSERLEQMVEPLLGGVTASVYGALLQALEGKQRARDDDIQVEESSEDRDADDEDLPSATIMEVAELLDPTIDLTLGISLPTELKVTNGDGQKKTKKYDMEFADIGIKREIESDEDEGHQTNGLASYNDRSKRLSLIDEHLKLLEEHSTGFCRKVGSGGRGEWKVNFPLLTDTLIQAEIDSTVSARFGKIHTRLVRLLRDRGRLEEKQVAAIALMRMKDVRALLTELQYAGFVEVQEVPKDNSRQPQRTVYLWFHDQSRVQSVLLQQTYQGMARTLQRHRQERENYRNVIDKAELMNLKHESLAQNEREAIMQWREMEEKLLIQAQRMDEMVALLRDFSGKDTSLVS